MRELSLRRRRRRGEIYAQVWPKLFIIARWGTPALALPKDSMKAAFLARTFWEFTILNSSKCDSPSLIKKLQV